MLEILLLIHFSKKIAAKARDRGYSGGLFVLLLLFFWFGGEIAGAVAAAVVLGDIDEAFFMVYVAALAGAAVGATCAFVIVGSLAPTHADEYDEYEYDDHDDRDKRDRY